MDTGVVEETRSAKDTTGWMVTMMLIWYMAKGIRSKVYFYPRRNILQQTQPSRITTKDTASAP